MQKFIIKGRTMILPVFVFIFVIGNVIAAEQCSKNTPSDSLPCNLYKQYGADACTNYNITVKYLVDNSTNNLSASSININLYQYDFDINKEGDYLISYCDDTSETIGVYDTQINVYIVFIAIIGMLVVFGYKYNEKVLLMFAGIIVIALGFLVSSNGYPDITNNFMKTMFAMPVWGIGIYLMASNGLKFIKEGW